MQLAFKEPYLSIYNLPDVEIPSFTVLTGPNGVGKSHLLHAIKKGHVTASDGDEIPIKQIERFDWSSLVPTDLAQVAVGQLHSTSTKLITSVEASRTEIEQDARSLFATSQVGVFSWAKYPELRGSDAEVAQLVKIEEHFSKRMDRRLRNRPEEKAMYDGYITSHDIATVIAEPELLRNALPITEVNIFQQSVGNIFLAYNELIANNLIKKELYPSEYLPSTDFVDKYGPKPWVLVNDTLKKCHLDFAISEPSVLNDRNNFLPIITKLSTGAKLNFSDMSSGERILISIALCLYNLDHDNVIVKKPRLVLFDEIDAVLHPSMVATVIDAIRNTIVKQSGVPVILTTHSPTTVAMSTDDSVFRVDPGVSLQHCGRQQAIFSLTEGIPTLAIDYLGRRQVFVESPSDVKWYENLWQSSHNKMKYKRSLHFIATGARSVSGDTNTGCSNVLRIVNDLRECGNFSVFGLIDWDLQNCTAGSVFVVGEGRFHSIENLLLNPLAIGLLLLNEDRSIRESLSLTFVKAVANLETHAQRVSDYVVSKLINIDTAQSDLADTYFSGNYAVTYSDAIRQYRGHDLDAMLRSVFPCLKSFGNHTDSLMLAVTDRIYHQVEDAIPREILNIFCKIDQYEAALADLHGQSG